MRVVNRMLSLLLGLGLVCGGLLVAAEATATALGAGPFGIPVSHWAALLEHRRLQDAWAVVGFTVATAVGAVLLLIEVWPWRPQRVAIGVDGPTSWWLSRRSVEMELRRATLDATPASHVMASVRLHRRRWEVRVRAAAPTDAHRAVTEAAQADLARLGAPENSHLRVRLRRPRHGARVA
jgi:hypothetical protein